MTSEEKAKERCRELLRSDNAYNGLSNADFWTNGYELGLEEGKPKWHDLRKDPNDLPKEGVEVLVLYSNTYNNGLVVNKSTLRYELAEYINDEEDLTEWYWVKTGLDDMVHEVIAWCELPRFEN